MTVNGLAMPLRVPANRIGGIVKGQRGITTDTALRLARYWGTSAEMCMNLQARYDLAMAEDAVGPRIEREVRRNARVWERRRGLSHEPYCKLGGGARNDACSNHFRP